MAYATIFDLVVSVCAKFKIPYVLIGGFAVNYHKVSRQTADADFLITEEDFNKITSLLEREGLKNNYTQEGVFARFSTGKPYFMDLDFMFVDKDTLGKIIKDAEAADIAGQKFMVPSLDHLIALKLHAIKYNPAIRERKDMPDILSLVQVNKIDVKDKKFKDLCLKYGTEALYRKILERA